MEEKILIVDDDEKNLKLLRVIFQNSGYEILEAKNGEDAVKLAKENVPALILMDLRMPVMDGITATKIIKSEPSTGKIPVIIVTSSAMAGDSERIISESGCDGYISKPIDVKEFREMVGKIIRL
jgi:two-component system cell cycle response regulator DivK